MGLGEALKKFAENFSTGAMAQKFGPSWQQDLVAKSLANQQQGQVIDRYREETPLRGAKMAAETEDLKARAEGRETVAERREREVGLLAQKQVFQQLKLAADHELDPTKKALMEQRMAALEADIQLKQATARLRDRTPGTGSGGGGGVPQLRQGRDAQGNAVWTWIKPGQEGVLIAPTAGERQVGGMANTVRGNLAKMRALADPKAEDPLTTGPFMGRASQLYQKVYGPDGPEGDFDFYGKAVVDTVYIKSGKQINETELKQLGQMIPNRARGNLAHQVDLFETYAKQLLAKYGAPEVEQEQSGPPGTAIDGGGEFKVLGVRDRP